MRKYIYDFCKGLYHKVLEKGGISSRVLLGASKFNTSVEILPKIIYRPTYAYFWLTRLLKLFQMENLCTQFDEHRSTFK